VSVSVYLQGRAPLVVNGHEYEADTHGVFLVSDDDAEHLFRDGVRTHVVRAPASMKRKS
jgi:hypothetical protein